MAWFNVFSALKKGKITDMAGFRWMTMIFHAKIVNLFQFLFLFNENLVFLNGYMLLNIVPFKFISYRVNNPSLNA